MAELVILEPAQRELEEIAQLHLNLVGPNSARKITDLILDTLSRLEIFPLSGHIPQDKELRNGGYRLVIAGKYICVYRLIADTVFVYHIAHGASNYPTTFKRLLKEENQEPIFRERLSITGRRFSFGGVYPTPMRWPLSWSASSGRYERRFPRWLSSTIRTA